MWAHDFAINFAKLMKTASQRSEPSIIVFDIGCRYGIYPTWRPLRSKEFLRYFAFDPDAEEISRLKKKYKNYKNYIAYELGFNDRDEKVYLNMLSHRGQSSFLTPIKDSLWFQFRDTEGTVIGQKLCHLTTIDSFSMANSIQPDFLKIDAEGFDYKILKGASTTLKKTLAVNCEVSFVPAFHGGAEFDQLYRLMIDEGFMLANLDYAGRGLPLSYFCPDPNKYGIYLESSALFIKNIDYIEKLEADEQLKLILFFFFNNLSDLSLRLLKRNSELRDLRDTMIWMEIKKQFALSVRKFLFLPGNSYDSAMADYKLIFDEDYPDKHTFLQSDVLNPA